MTVRKTIVLIVLLLAFLVFPTVAAAAPSYDQAVDSLVSQGYPQSIETYLNSLGTSPLGYRLGGTVGGAQGIGLSCRETARRGAESRAP